MITADINVDGISNDSNYVKYIGLSGNPTSYYIQQDTPRYAIIRCLNEPQDGYIYLPTTPKGGNGTIIEIIKLLPDYFSTRKVYLNVAGGGFKESSGTTLSTSIEMVGERCRITCIYYDNSWYITSTNSLPSIIKVS